jgi:hypothetical protein
MNNNPDNFHDWHRNKADTTSFSGLQRNEIPSYKRQSEVRWGRLAFWVMVAIVLVAGFKYFVSH